MDIIMGILIIGFGIFGYNYYNKYKSEKSQELNEGESSSLVFLGNDNSESLNSVSDQDYFQPTPFAQPVRNIKNSNSDGYSFNPPKKGKYHFDNPIEKSRSLPPINTSNYDTTDKLQQEIMALVQERDNLLLQINHNMQLVQESSISNTSLFNDVGYYDFDNPAENSILIKDQLDVLKKETKELLKSKEAINVNSGFSYNNSRTEGDKFISKLSNLGLMAYNSEVENVIKNIKKSNMDASIRRIERVKDQVAKAGEVIGLIITGEYHQMRLKELELSYKYIILREEERLKEKERKDKLREEKKANEELARRKKELEDKLKKEESHYNTALELLKKSDTVENKEEIIKMEETLEEIKKGIKDVDYRSANSRAGYVYVISNIGSFGENIVKIGMTRRLNPEDRVKELGDASVPFEFDTHLMHFSDDAVGVENKLHQHFAKERVNLVNNRREFFYTTPRKVREALKKIDGTVVEYNEKTMAEQFNASNKIREEMILQ